MLAKDRKVIVTGMQGHGRTKDKAPMFMAIGDADGIRYEHALELFRAKGGGKMGDIHGLPKSRPAIVPGTTHIGMMQRTDYR